MHTRFSISVEQRQSEKRWCGTWSCFRWQLVAQFHLCIPHAKETRGRGAENLVGQLFLMMMSHKLDTKTESKFRMMITLDVLGNRHFRTK